MEEIYEYKGKRYIAFGRATVWGRTDLTRGDEVVIYTDCETGRMWARSATEFADKFKAEKP